MVSLSSQALSARTFLVVALLAASVFFFSVIPQSGFVFPHLVNSGHCLVFGLGAYLLLHLLVQSYRLNQIVLVAFLAFSLGLVIELLQPLVGRQRSLVDALYDFMGCSAAALWFYSFAPTLRSAVKYSFRLLALLIVLSSLLYPAYRFFVLHQVNKLAPVMADFESFWWKNTMWANNHAKLQRSDAPDPWLNESSVGRLVFPEKARYPGLSLAYLIEDWHQYRYLQFEIFSVQQEASVAVIRIHDSLHNNEYHDRFNRELVIQPGLNSFEIDLADVKSAPKKREMDMGRISDLKLFMSRPSKDMVFYIDNIRLAR